MLWWMLLCTEHWMWHRPRDWWQGWSKRESSRECGPLGTVQQMDQILAQQQLADYKWNMKHRWWWLFCSCLILVFFFVWIFQSLVCPGCHCLLAHTWRCRLQIFFFQALTMNWWTLAAETQKTRKLEKKIINHEILIFFLRFSKNDVSIILLILLSLSVKLFLLFRDADEWPNTLFLDCLYFLRIMT